MEETTTEFLAEVAAYYSTKLAEHGETPRGVDWNSEASQVLRFAQLTKVIEPATGFSLNDLGCGYGALFDYLDGHCRDFIYSGCDVSADMVRTAQARLDGRLNARFCVAAAPPEAADYGIASGIFNVRLGRSDAEWRSYLEATLDVLDRTSRQGFAFNCLTRYSMLIRCGPTCITPTPAPYSIIAGDATRAMWPCCMTTVCTNSRSL